jgi:hypothetical protein
MEGERGGIFFYIGRKKANSVNEQYFQVFWRRGKILSLGDDFRSKVKPVFKVLVNLSNIAKNIYEKNIV